MEDDNNENSISAEEYHEIMTERWAGEICPSEPYYEYSIEDFILEYMELLNADETSIKYSDSE